MRKKGINKKAYIVVLVTMIVVSFTYIVMALGSEPGSTDDPIVTKSYVELRNEQLKFYIDENIKKLQQSIDKITGSTDNGGVTGGYEVVNVPIGKKLIAGASTEMILRAGKATVIDSKSGGLADVTIGKDLKLGENVPQNHLLIIPRDDGRGAKAVSDSIFMVKGSYHVE